MPRKKVTPAQIERAKRDSQILNLRVRGVSLQAIADQVGLATPSAVSKAIDRALAQVPAEGVDRLRMVQNEQLGLMMVNATTIFNNAKAGKQYELALKAMDRQLRIVERAAKLNGLDAPTQHEVTGDAITTIMWDPQVLGITATGGEK